METKTWQLKLTLLLVSCLTIMSVITISPALPQMAAVFAGVKNAGFIVKMVLTIPALMIAIVSPIIGRLIDRHGRLRMLRLALVGYAIFGSGGFFLNNLYYILISRALLGVSVGVSMTIVITLIADYFAGIERQKFVGTQIAFMSIGGIIFIAAGGVLADVGWRYPFLLYFISLLILPLTIIFLKEPAIVQKQFNQQGIKASPVSWLLYFNIMVMWIIFFIIPVQIPFYLKSLGVENNSSIGVAIAISTTFSAMSSYIYSRIKARFGFLSIFSMGYLLMASGFACIAAADTYVLVVVAMALSGLGMGMMIPNTNMWVMTITPPQIRGREIGKLTTFWFLGQFLSPIIVLPVINNLSLASTFMLAAALLLLISLGFLIFLFRKTAGPSVQ
jgi:MFS family permease